MLWSRDSFLIYICFLCVMFDYGKLGPYYHGFKVVVSITDSKGPETY